MVLRGAQFQRSGPAGCTFLARQALSSYPATLVHRQADAVRTQWAHQILHKPLVRFRGDPFRYLLKDSRRLARAGDLCHGRIGESSSAS